MWILSKKYLHSFFGVDGGWRLRQCPYQIIFNPRWRFLRVLPRQKWWARIICRTTHLKGKNMFYLKNRLIEFGEGSSRRELDNKDLVRSKAISVLKPRNRFDQINRIKKPFQNWDSFNKYKCLWFDIWVQNTKTLEQVFISIHKMAENKFSF